MDKNQDGVRVDQPQDTEMTNSEESSTEQNREDETLSSGGDNNQDGQNNSSKDSNESKPKDLRDEHPRFKEVLEENRRIKEKLSEYDQKWQKVEPLLSKFNNEDDEKIPPWFGGDKESWKAYKTDQDARDKRVAEQAIKEWETKTQRERELITQAQNHFNTSVKEIETDSGKKFDDSTKNRLLKITEQYQLVDQQGRWNYKAAYEIMKAQDHARQEAKQEQEEVKSGQVKRMINISNKEKPVETKSKDYMTNEDFQTKRPW